MLKAKKNKKTGKLIIKVKKGAKPDVSDLSKNDAKKSFPWKKAQ